MVISDRRRYLILDMAAVASRRTLAPIDIYHLGPLLGLSQIIEIRVVFRILRVFRIV